MGLRFEIHMKLFRSLVAIVTIALLSISIPSWGMFEPEPWNSPTPGGNEIGECDTCPGKGIAIYRGSKAYVEEIKDFGFYDRAIIGRAAKGYFAFDEYTKQTVYFETRQQLCTQVKAAHRQWNNTLRYFNSSYPIDYYAIKYSLYILFPFIVLFLVFCLRSKSNLDLSQRIDWILRSKRFALILLVSTAFSKYFVSVELVTLEHPLDEIEHLFVALLYCIIFTLVWAIGWLCIQKISLSRYYSPAITSVLKIVFYVGILMFGLSFTVGLIQAPDTSIRFFSCEQHSKSNRSD